MLFRSPPSFGGPEIAPPPPPPAGGEAGPEAPAPGGEELGGITPESKQKDMNILVENNLIEGAEIINLSHGQDSLGEISKELDKLLNS